MKKIKKLLSFLLTLALVMGTFVPVIAAGETTKITIHKIKLNSLDGFPLTLQPEKNAIEGKKDPTVTYDGGQIGNITGFFGDGAEELAGVTFTYWKVDKANYETMLKDSENYKTVDQVKALTTTDGTDVKTGANGVQIDTKLQSDEEAYYWFVEKSTSLADGSTISGAKAVPFGLALPLHKADGSINQDIHVYPKNIVTNKPQVDKDFKNPGANAAGDRNEITNNVVEDHNVGDKIEYDIETIIPAGAQYKTAVWTDQMTEGLTFNKDIQVSIGDKGKETALVAEDYTVTEDGNGFVLKLNETGLAKINGQANNTRLYITYSATLNDKAIVERLERNDVIFHYGNNPSHGNTPYPTKPSNGELTVTKSFDGGNWAEGEKITVTLYDAHTGKAVTSEEINGQQPTVELTKGGKLTHTWTGLDNNKQYKVVETFKAGDEVSYEKGVDGQVIIHDKKTDNPTPLDPQEPAVKTGGHRFQKVDQNGKGLEGAIFVIKNDQGKYLKKKDVDKAEIDQIDYAAKEKAYKDAVKAGNADTSALKAARDEAYRKANNIWEFVDEKDKAASFTADEQGFFKVTGLKKGAYKLEETKAPAGFALRKDDIDFNVTDNSFDVTTLEGEKLKDDGLTQVENRDLTIPQTGGIGTIIFIVAGIALMGGALIAMKQRNRVEE